MQNEANSYKVNRLSCKTYSETNLTKDPCVGIKSNLGVSKKKGTSCEKGEMLQFLTN